MAENEVRTVDQTDVSVSAEQTPPKPDKKEKKEKAEKPKKKTGSKKKSKVIRRIILILLIAAAVFFGINIVGVKRIPVLRSTPLADMKIFNLFTKSVGVSADDFTGATVVRRTVEKTLTGSGTLEPNDSYNVTALASGEITEDFFEEGDVVAEDQLLLKIDSSNLESSLERAQNAYDSAYDSLQDLYEDRADLTVKSDWAGTVKIMDLEVGDDVNAGMAVATILDDETMLVDVPFLQSDAFSMSHGMAATVTVSSTLEEIAGTVDSVDAGYTTNEFGVKVVDVTVAVHNPGGITEGMAASAAVGEMRCTGEGRFYYNVNEVIKAETGGKVRTIVKVKGDHVNKGETVVILESKQLADNITRSERTLKEAKNSLDDAKDAFDNYNIKAPIAGTVIQKNFKKGEKIGGGSNQSNVIAIIYDMSSLKFDMNIDELDIDAIALGQEVKITCDAHAGQSYVGYVTQISVVGTTQNGTTYYPITVTMTDYGNDAQGNKLKPGMNIDAEIVLDRAENALVIPSSYLGRGNTVMVVRAADAAPLLEAANNPGASGFTGRRHGTDTAGEAAEKSEDTKETEDTAGRPSFGEDENGETHERPSFGDGENGEMPSFPNHGDGENGEMPSFPNHGDGESTETTDGTGSTGFPNFGGFGGFNAIPTYISVPRTAAYETVTVTTGISDEDYVVITSGLEEGDVVLLEDSSAVAEGWNGWGGYGGMSGGMASMHGGMGMGGGMGGGYGGYGGMGGGGMPGGMR